MDLHNQVFASFVKSFLSILEYANSIDRYYARYQSQVKLTLKL